MQKNGFTLLEVLIYIALLGMLLGGAFGVVFQILASAQKVSDAQSTLLEGDFVMHKINWVLSDIASSTTPSAAMPYSDTLLVTTSAGTKLIVRRNSTINRIEMSEDGGLSFLPISAKSAPAGSLQFYYNAEYKTIEASTTLLSDVFTTTKFIRL